MKKILFAFCFFAGLTAMAQTPVTTRRVNTDSIVERKLEFGIDMIGALRMHDSVWMLTVPAISSPDAILSIDTVTGAVTRTLIDDILPADTTYPDSSVMITDNNGQPSTDSNDLAWKGNGLYLLNRNNAVTAVGALVITGSTASSLSRVTHSMSNASANTDAQYVFFRSAGTPSAPTTVVNNLRLGSIVWGGYNGTIWNTGVANIRAVGGGTWSSSATPSYFQFTTGDANNVSFTTTLTQKGTLAIKGTNADSVYDLTVNGTAAITSTPEIVAGTTDVSILLKDNSTDQVISTTYQQGVYVPVDSAGSNVDAVTPDTAFYTRVGNIVTVSGVVEIDPTTTLTPTFFYLNLPVFPANWGTNKAGGTFAAYIVNESGAVIMGGPTSVIFQFNPTSTGANIFSYTYSYRIQ